MKARDYREAGRLLRLVSSGRRSLKSALFNEGFRSNKRLLCAVVCKTLERRRRLERLLVECGAFVDVAEGGGRKANGKRRKRKEEEEEDGDLWDDGGTAAGLPGRHECLVRACDLLLNGGAASGDKLGQLLLLNCSPASVADVSLPDDGAEASASASAASAESLRLPRYARVNTLLCDLDSLLTALADDGYRRLPTPGSYDDFLETARSLAPREFLADYHVPLLLVFSPSAGVDVARHRLCADGRLCLVDKASCLPPICLRPASANDGVGDGGVVILDACAAPGNKTAHLAAIVADSPRPTRIVAVDKSPERLADMRRLLSLRGVRIADGVDDDGDDGVLCLRADFLQLRRRPPPGVTQQLLDSVTHILLDPSCSGSGIRRHADRGGGGRERQRQQQQPDRIAALANFQATALKSALTDYPSAQRVVYSTCSLHAEENEAVVEEMATRFTDTWRLARAAPNWPTRGLSNFACGAACVRCDPERHLTNGFFVACFKRRRRRRRRRGGDDGDGDCGDGEAADE